MQPPKKSTFAAVIGHADEADILRQCITHHLQIGIDTIFVSLNREDPAGQAVIDAFAATGQVRGAQVRDFAQDEFEFYTAAVRVVRDWAAPDWLIFVDSDEFWLPASGHVAGTHGLDGADLLVVERFNAPPLRAADGSVEYPRAVTPDTEMFGRAEAALDGLPLAPSAETSFVATMVGPKIMVRPEIVRKVGRGAHTIESDRESYRTRESRDMLIVHLPFTSLERFRAKVEAVHARMAAFGHRFKADQAHQWRRWLQLREAGRIDEEFDVQVVDAAQAERLRARNLLVTARQVFSEWERGGGRPKGAASQRLLRAARLAFSDPRRLIELTARKARARVAGKPVR